MSKRENLKRDVKKAIRSNKTIPAVLVEMGLMSAAPEAAGNRMLVEVLYELGHERGWAAGREDLKTHARIKPFR